MNLKIVHPDLVLAEEILKELPPQSDKNIMLNYELEDITDNFQNWLALIDQPIDQDQESLLLGFFQTRIHTLSNGTLLAEMGAVRSLSNGMGEKLVEAFNIHRAKLNILMGCAVVSLENKEALDFFTQHGIPQTIFPEGFDKKRDLDNRCIFILE